MQFFYFYILSKLYMRYVDDLSVYYMERFGTSASSGLSQMI